MFFLIFFVVIPANSEFLSLTANTLPTLPDAIAASASMLPLQANMQQRGCCKGSSSHWHGIGFLYAFPCHS